MTERKPISEARKRANKKWNDENQTKRYDRIQLVVPKGRKNDIDEYAKAQGESVNGMMNTLLRKAIGMSEEEWKTISDDPRGT
nr:hypothetical protein [Clostridia bacterium]